jgi:hypothetical protein
MLRDNNQKSMYGSMTQFPPDSDGFHELELELSENRDSFIWDSRSLNTRLEIHFIHLLWQYIEPQQNLQRLESRVDNKVDLKKYASVTISMVRETEL